MDEPPLAAPTKNEVPMLKILTLRDGTRFQPAFNQARCEGGGRACAAFLAAPPAARLALAL